MRPAQPTERRRRAAGTRRGVLVGLDHADDAVAGDRRVDHGEVARLEDVERHVGARQEKRRRKRKDRNHRRHVAGAAINAVTGLHRTSRDPIWRPSQVRRLREQQRRQTAASGKRRLVRRTPSLEELNQLLAGLFLLPTTVPGNDFKEAVEWPPRGRPWRSG